MSRLILYGGWVDRDVGGDAPLKIAVIGDHTQEGVPSGTGSSAVMPVRRSTPAPPPFIADMCCASLSSTAPVTGSSSGR